MENETTATDPLRFATSIKSNAEFLRLPPSGQCDPIFGLKRSFLNLLILPSPENDWRPPVKSIVLRRKRKKKGVRLIELASLRAYIQEQTETEERSLEQKRATAVPTATLKSPATNVA